MKKTLSTSLSVFIWSLILILVYTNHLFNIQKSFQVSFVKYGCTIQINAHRPHKRLPQRNLNALNAAFSVQSQQLAVLG